MSGSIYVNGKRSVIFVGEILYIFWLFCVMKYVINSVENMIKLWYDLSNKLNYHKILLHGDLWAGKTHLTKWWVQWILDKINKSEYIYNVNSPTYTYYQTYGNILHLDMYRLEEYADLVAKWILDQIMDHEYIAVEWPRYTDYYIDSDYYNIYISKNDDDSRAVEVI